MNYESKTSISFSNNTCDMFLTASKSTKHTNENSNLSYIKIILKKKKSGLFVMCLAVSAYPHWTFLLIDKVIAFINFNKKIIKIFLALLSIICFLIYSSFTDANTQVSGLHVEL